MKTLYLAVTAALLLASPAAALTLDQAQAELAGMYCDSSKCVSFQETTTVTDLPDIDLPDTYRTESFGGISGFNVVTIPPSLCNAGFDWACDGAWNQPTSQGIGRRTVTIDGGVTDGGTATAIECTRTKKVLTYNGPYTSRDMAWSIETTIASLPGNCPQ